MHRCLLLTLLLMLPNPADASLSADQLQVIRTHAFTLCSNLLVYYNLNLDGRDPLHAGRYRQRLQELQQWLAMEKDSALA